MRILFFSSIFPHATAPVTGTFNWELCRALAAEHEVRVVAPRSFLDVWRHRQTRHEEASGNHCVSETFGIDASYPTFFYVPKVGRQYFGTAMWHSVRKHLDGVLDEFRPEAIVSYWAHPDGEVGLRAARQIGVPAIVNVGGSDVLLLTKSAARRRKVVRVLMESDAVTTVSEGLRQKVIELGVPPERVVTIYQGVDTERFHQGDMQQARKLLSLPADRPLLLWVGRMVDVKGLDVLIAAIDQLRQRVPNVLLALAGDGPQRDAVVRDVFRRGLQDHVRLVGPIQHLQLPDWYRAVNLSVLSSWSEGLPNVLRESLACGRPFVSTDVGSVREIADSRGGPPFAEYVPIGDALTMAQAIERVLHHDYIAAAQTLPSRTWLQSTKELTEVLRRARGELPAETHCDNRYVVSNGLSSTFKCKPLIADSRFQRSKLAFTNHNPRVLVVAYAFPPVGGAGVQRATKFVKYLPDFGWDVTVLTVENPSVPVFDESLLADIPPQTTIVKARTLEPGYSLKRVFSASTSEATEQAACQSGVLPSKLAAVKSFLRKALRAVANVCLQPDPQVLWQHHAVKAGSRALSERKYEAIFVTAPPFSSLLVGAELSRRTGLPLVLDYRDEWEISNAYWENKRQGVWSRWLQRRMQRSVVRAASALVATTRGSAEALANVAADAGCHPLVTHIYNGFDAAELYSGPPPLPDPVLMEPDAPTVTYKLAYVGTLWNLTSVEPLVQAVRLLCEQTPDLASRLELHFAGRRTGQQDQLLNRLDGLPCRVVRHPYVDHDAALRLMQSANGLLLLLSDVPDANRVVPAKLFEYLAIRKPILAIVPPGEVTELLQDYPIGFVHSPSDISGLAQRLGDEIERHRFGVPVTAGLWDPARFERRQLTRQLADLLNQVANRRSRAETVAPRHPLEDFPSKPAAWELREIR